MNTITDIVAASGDYDTNGGDFDILLRAAQAAGLAGTLATVQDLTVFAPTDDAFLGLAAAYGFTGTGEEAAFNYIVDTLTLLGGGNPIPLLTTVLTYHVAGEALNSTEVLARDSIDTLSGFSFDVNGLSLGDNDPDVPDPTIILPNVGADNGIIHVIDGVLIPADIPQPGQNGTDFEIGTDASERFITREGNDFIDGNGGKDFIFAGKGDDVAIGGRGNDLLFGQKGNDLLIGAEGHDKIFGGKGNDTIEGGAGNDLLLGGSGRDTFVFKEGDGDDTILGFRAGKDKIDLTAFGLSDISEVEIDTGFFGTEIEVGDVDIYLAGIGGVHVTADDFLL
ncbi:fasciclin domain-containing protein [Pseudoruegeria sp. SHC-113]|uniref:fasciclin domain-containing protein n=1 Tax=Pseudoruegeria sp. SHC-113 TaxID=2855439 RepID=UPI0021BB1337|nr:fasciclin domain-containing protein [Pseudoruegeria sp. SHC-113]MCT8162064.1 fasciclin domain-containing protein [Pseudoruegeria sp. SHC-113]